MREYNLATLTWPDLPLGVGVGLGVPIAGRHFQIILMETHNPDVCP